MHRQALQKREANLVRAITYGLEEVAIVQQRNTIYREKAEIDKEEQTLRKRMEAYSTQITVQGKDIFIDVFIEPTASLPIESHLPARE